MAKMTASDFITVARQALGGVDTGLLSDTLLLRFVNQSYIGDVCSVYPLSELDATTTITCVSGTAEYSTGVDDILKILTVTDTTVDIDLTDYEISREHYQFLTQGNSVSGDPTHWFISGVESTYSRPQITFFPTPNRANSITIAYRLKPTELATSPSATSTIFQYQWDDVILAFTASRGWRFLGDLQKSQYWRQEATTLARAAFSSSGRSNTQPREFGSNILGALGG